MEIVMVIFCLFVFVYAMLKVHRGQLAKWPEECTDPKGYQKRKDDKEGAGKALDPIYILMKGLSSIVQKASPS